MYSSNFIILFVSLLGFNLEHKVCGLPTGKIVGGEIAERGQFPYQVQIQLYNYQHACGGAIVNNQWIVTAGHCTRGYSAGSASIMVNQYNIGSNEGTERRHQVTQIVRHPGFNDSISTANDIALMKVRSPFVLDEFVQPIALAPKDLVIEEGATATLSGWGKLSSGGSTPIYLHYVDVPIVSDQTCADAYAKLNETTTESMICAGTQVGGIGPCQGDSGGPMALKSNGTNYLVGIISWGQGCADPGFPSVNTEVSYFLDWIESVISE